MENYAYWQASGGGWYEEYRQRKTFLPYLNLQEILIASIVSRAAPAKVLEYGSGVGRHLEYLHRVPGIGVHGYDQSPTMTAEIERWAPPGFADQNVTIGSPVQTLPFGDGEFDIVYTCEVLVHIRPEDLPVILAELLRISKGLVFHLEPDPSTSLVPDAHGGCWGHDLVAAYAALGQSARTMPRLFECQLPVVIEREPNGSNLEKLWPAEIVADRFRAAEQNLRATLDPAVDEGIPWIDESLDVPTAVAQGALSRLPRRMLVDAVTSLLPERDQLHTRIDRLERELGHARNFREYVEASEHLPLCCDWATAVTPDFVRIEIVQPNPQSNGCQAWLRFARATPEAPANPWSAVTLPPGWQLCEAPGCTDDLALRGDSGFIDLPGGPAPVLSFMKHAWSGRIKVCWRDQEWIVDLFSSDTSELTIALGALAAETAQERAC